jgi:cupin fold WbuC family metalloprotein
MSTLNLRKVNDEVFVSQDMIVKIGPAEVAFVKAQAAANGRKRARICAHKTNDDTLHEMVIAISAQSYIHPHKHIGKSESFHVIEGLVDVVVFDDDGTVAEIIELGDPTTGRAFYYRIAQSAFHTLLLKTDFLVVHEVTNGPFARDKTVLANWAPPEDRAAEASEYIRRVAQLARTHKPAINQSGA